MTTIMTTMMKRWTIECVAILALSSLFVLVNGVNDGIAIFSDGSRNPPGYALWNGYDFEGSQEMIDISGYWRIIQGAYSPKEDQAIVIGVTDDEVVTGQIYENGRWSDLPFTPLDDRASNSYWWGFDVRYESQSGHPLVVYHEGSRDTIRYASWTGSRWSMGTINTPVRGGEHDELNLEASPKTDEIVLIVAVRSGNDYAIVWDGDSWGDGVDLRNGDNDDLTNVNVAYEQQSGRAMVIYAARSTSLKYRIWNGNSWSVEHSVSAPSGIRNRIRRVAIGADPSTNRIVVGVTSYSDNAFWVAVWGGHGNWESKIRVASGSSASIFHGIAVAFEGTSQRALATYTQSSDEVRYITWSPSSGWSGELRGPNLGARPNSMMLYTDHGSNDIMLAVQDNDQDANFCKWNGSDGSWSGVTRLTSNTGESLNKNQPYFFMWKPVTSTPPPTPSPTRQPTPPPTSMQPTTSPTSSPTEKPTLCVDDPPGWHDRDGEQYNCDWYREDDNCQQYGNFFENFGAVANVACCGCGGGNRLAVDEITPTPTPQPTRSPTANPTETPTNFPTAYPTWEPTEFPTDFPTWEPSAAPTDKPSNKPSPIPTRSTTASPSDAPTKKPTQLPTRTPTPPPSRLPTPQPSPLPTISPTPSPITATPSANPTDPPTKEPSAKPTQGPTRFPTKAPSSNPTGFPTPEPSAKPTQGPTQVPTPEPTLSPTQSPTSFPTTPITPSPTQRITETPTSGPTRTPTVAPTTSPTSSPTTKPTETNTPQPSPLPTTLPPSPLPTVKPTGTPTPVPTKARGAGVFDPSPSPTKTNSTYNGQVEAKSVKSGRPCNSNSECISNTCRSGVCMYSSACYPLKHKFGTQFHKHKVNIVFVASGFNTATKDEWKDRVDHTFKSFENYTFFGNNIEQLNMFRVDPWKLDSSFCSPDCAGIARLLCCDQLRAMALATKCFPVGSNLQTVVIHNSELYGGAGYRFDNIATVTVHPRAPLIAAHELGHSLFDLTDEYSYGPGTDSEANCASTSKCDKWSDLIDNTPARYDPVQCLPGCRNNNFYVASRSFMNDLNSPMGAVNERFTCCTYQALTKSFPAYCNVFDPSPNYLLNYCRDKDYQQYGRASYDVEPLLSISDGTRQDPNTKFVQLDKPVFVSIVPRTQQSGETKYRAKKQTPLDPGMFLRTRVQGDFPSPKKARKAGVDSLLKVLVFYRTGRETLYFALNTTVEVPLAEDTEIEEEEPLVASLKADSINIILDTKSRTIKRIGVKAIDL